MLRIRSATSGPAEGSSTTRAPLQNAATAIVTNPAAAPARATARDTRRSGRSSENPRPRSEEHTSELQSLMRISYAVFCLKKTKTKCKTLKDKSTTPADDAY